jgi:hypothetical protein
VERTAAPIRLEARTRSLPEPMSQTAGLEGVARVFPARGDVARLCRAKDRGRTPLGPIELWPESLRTIAGLVLDSPFPMIVLWGPELAGSRSEENYPPNSGVLSPFAGRASALPW